MTGIDILDFVAANIGTFTVTVIGGGGGAYFGAYLKKSAENKAIHENLGKLVVEMKAVTQATKEIEAKISEDVWGRQRRWELRRDIMLKAMDDLTDVQGPLAALTAASVALEIETDEGMRKASLEKLTTASAALTAVMPSLFRSMYKIQLVCGGDLQQRFRSVQDMMFAAYHQISQNNAPDAVRMTSEIGRATELAQAAIRQELGIDADYPMVTPQSSESSAVQAPD